MPEPSTPSEQLPAKAPPDPEKIKALLDMAAMQSNSAIGHKPPYKALAIVAIVVVLLMIVSYAAVSWAAHHY